MENSTTTEVIIVLIESIIEKLLCLIILIRATAIMIRVVSFRIDSSTRRCLVSLPISSPSSSTWTMTVVVPLDTIPKRKP